jgi:hypothetical protein
MSVFIVAFLYAPLCCHHHEKWGTVQTVVIQHAWAMCKCHWFLVATQTMLVLVLPEPLPSSGTVMMHCTLNCYCLLWLHTSLTCGSVWYSIWYNLFIHSFVCLFVYFTTLTCHIFQSSWLTCRPLALHNSTLRPIIGNATICLLTNDFESDLQSVVHEMLHALGWVRLCPCSLDRITSGSCPQFGFSF